MCTSAQLAEQHSHRRTWPCSVANYRDAWHRCTCLLLATNTTRCPWQSLYTAASTMSSPHGRYAKACSWLNLHSSNDHPQVCTTVHQQPLLSYYHLVNIALHKATMQTSAPCHKDDTIQIQGSTRTNGCCWWVWKLYSSIVKASVATQPKKAQGQQQRQD
jgi:hypothetical protein